MLWGTLLAFIVGVVGVMIALHHEPAPKEVVLAGSPTTMGTTYSDALYAPMRLLLSAYLKRGVCGGDEARFLGRCKLAENHVESVLPAYQDELRAVAESADLSLGEVAYGNWFLDMGNARAGCRTVVCPGESGLLHAHNLDWDNLAGFARWTVTVVRRAPDDGRFRTVSVSFPGMIGAIDIINEHGIALSFNQLGHGRGECSEPVFLMLRRIAEHCDSFAAAREEILNSPAGMPFIITLSDAKSGESAIFERKREEIVERQGETWLAADNTARGPETAPGLQAALREHAPRDLTALKAVLRDSRVMLSSNIYAVIFDFQANQFHLASGAIPAAESASWRRYPLF